MKHMWLRGETTVRSHRLHFMSLASRAAAQPVPRITSRGLPARDFLVGL